MIPRVYYGEIILPSICSIVGIMNRVRGFFIWCIQGWSIMRIWKEVGPLQAFTPPMMGIEVLEHLIFSEEGNVFYLIGNTSRAYSQYLPCNPFICTFGIAPVFPVLPGTYVPAWQRLPCAILFP